MTKEALKLALEALETCGEDEWHSDDDYGMMQVYDEDKVNEAIAAIKEALAQPEQGSTLREQLAKTRADRDKAKADWVKADADWVNARVEMQRIQKLIDEEKNFD